MIKSSHYAISHSFPIWSLCLLAAVGVDLVVPVIQAGQSASKRRLLCHLQK